MSGKLRKAIEAYRKEYERFQPRNGSWEERKPLLMKESELTLAFLNSLNVVQKEALKHLIFQPTIEHSVWPKAMRAYLHVE